MNTIMKDIKDFFAIYSQAAWEKDTEMMIGLYHENVVVFDMWEKGYEKGLTSWTNSIVEWLTSLNEERVKVTFEKVEAHEKADIGFAYAIIGFQAISPENNVLRSMKNRISLGFVKNEGIWKVIHQHTSAPINFNLDGILDF